MVEYDGGKKPTDPYKIKVNLSEVLVELFFLKHFCDFLEHPFST